MFTYCVSWNCPIIFANDTWLNHTSKRSPSVWSTGIFVCNISARTLSMQEHFSAKHIVISYYPIRLFLGCPQISCRSCNTVRCIRDPPALSLRRATYCYGSIISWFSSVFPDESSDCLWKQPWLHSVFLLFITIFPWQSMSYNFSGLNTVFIT